MLRAPVRWPQPEIVRVSLIFNDDRRDGKSARTTPRTALCNLMMAISCSSVPGLKFGWMMTRCACRNDPPDP